jgi:hypothetical protein
MFAHPPTGTEVPPGTAIGVTLGRFNPNQCGPFPC